MCVCGFESVCVCGGGEGSMLKVKMRGPKEEADEC